MIKAVNLEFSYDKDKEFIKEVISSFEKYNNNEDAKYNNMKEYYSQKTDIESTQTNQ